MIVVFPRRKLIELMIYIKNISFKFKSINLDPEVQGASVYI